MTDRGQISRQMADHYEEVWQAGDAWGFEDSAYEQARYDYLARLLGERRYARALELGCGSGQFTRRLAQLADYLLAVDIAPAAIARARATGMGAAAGEVEFRAADVMSIDLQAGGPWDLISFCETIYCLGWLYPVFDVAWLAARLYDATAPGGRLLLANTYSDAEKDWLLRPWLIDTYRDLFRNVGYRLHTEDVFRGTKGEVEFRVSVCLFEKPARNIG